MSTAIASALRALDRHPVSYETTATDTIIEADTVEQVFAAVQAAHQAIPDDRVITSVEIDEDRRRPQNMNERVASVERELGHPPQRRQHPQPQRGPAQTQSQVGGRSTGMQPSGQPTGMQSSGQSMGAQRPGQPRQSKQPLQQPQSQQSVRSAQNQQSGQPPRNRPPEHPPGPY